MEATILFTYNKDTSMLLTIFTIVLCIIIAVYVVLPILGFILECLFGLLMFFGGLVTELVWLRWATIIGIGYLGAMLIFGW
jgi:hypothetical protein